MANIYWPFDTSCVSEWCGGYADVRSGIHMGTDFAVPQGTELRATTDGTVRVYLDNGYGTGVDITNDNGIVVRNWHLSEVHVSNGQWVTAGQIIGLTGGGRGTWGAGNSTGPHLHWELRDNARFNDVGWIDPRGLTIYSFDGSAPAPVAPTVGLQGEGIRGQGNDWTYWVPGTQDQMTVQSRLAERGLYSGPIDGDLASDASVRAIKLACGELGYFDLTYLDGVINKNLCYGILLLAQNNGGYSGGFNSLFTDGYVWAAFDGGVASSIAVTAPPVAESVPGPVAEVVEEKEKPKKKPSVKPENKEHKEKPVAEVTPVSKEEIKSRIAHQSALASGIQPADLGSIITHSKTRKIVWAIYGLTGLAIAVMGGLTAAQWIAAEWFIFATGAYTAIGPAFASLAVANIDTKK